MGRRIRWQPHNRANDRGSVVGPNEHFDGTARGGDDDPRDQANQPGSDERPPQDLDGGRAASRNHGEARDARADRQQQLRRHRKHGKQRQHREQIRIFAWRQQTRHGPLKPERRQACEEAEAAKHHGVAGNDARPRGSSPSGAGRRGLGRFRLRLAQWSAKRLDPQRSPSR